MKKQKLQPVGKPQSSPLMLVSQSQSQKETMLMLRRKSILQQLIIPCWVMCFKTSNALFMACNLLLSVALKERGGGGGGLWQHMSQPDMLRISLMKCIGQKIHLHLLWMLCTRIIYISMNECFVFKKKKTHHTSHANYVIQACHIKLKF